MNSPSVFSLFQTCSLILVPLSFNISEFQNFRNSYAQKHEIHTHTHIYILPRVQIESCYFNQFQEKQFNNIGLSNSCVPSFPMKDIFLRSLFHNFHHRNSHQYIYLKYECIFLWGTLFCFGVLASACYLLICRYLAGQLCLNLASHNLAKFSYHFKDCPKHVMVVSTWNVGSPAHTGILT